jgi:hypothetical protein
VLLDRRAEDIPVGRRRGLAYLSFLDRASVKRGEPQDGTALLTYDSRREPRPRQVHLGDGAKISGGTVAAAWRDEFLIGAVLDRKVLVCRQNR